MAGYTRQSVADIISGEVVKAAPLNAEFNALRDAFAFATGHTHDGSSTSGAYIGLIADTDGNNKVVVDTSNNRVSFYTEVTGSPVEQIRIQDGAIVPVTDDDIDLGASGAEFKNLWIDGTANIDALVSAAVTITGGNIDGTIIGASTPAAGSFTTVTTSGLATLASADINGGTVDGAVIGGSTAGAITGTTITANTGFTGDVTGDVTGNLTGNVTGNVTGNLTGAVTGNVTAASGTSTFNNVTVNGTLDVTGTTIANVTDPVNPQDAATKNYVDTEVAALVDSAPAALDTLNELAAALGDDADFATTVTDSIATKLPLAGGTMTGAIAMGTNKITGMGDPTSAQDAATKTYVDTADNLKLNLSGGTLSGNLVMGSNKVTSTATPTTDDDLTRKAYVDSILGSATSAADSAAAAAISETNAGTSETNAGNSASAAATSASNAATSYDNFDDRYLGQKSSDPALDNDGDALLTGAIYFNTSDNKMKVYTGSAWVDVAPVATSVTEAQISDLGTTIVLDTDIGVTVQGYDADTAKYDDVTANFTGTLQNGGSNVVVDTDIGSTVQGYDADTAKYDDATANFTGTLQNGGSNVVVDTDIGSTVLAYDSNLQGFVDALTLPTSDGSDGQALVTNGAGTISFGSAGISTGKAIAMAIVFG